MATQQRRVVVTGMGFVTPIGHDTDTVWSNLIEGVSGVGQITRFDTASYSTKIAAEVTGFDPTDFMDKKSARHMARFAQFALGASRKALEQAALDPAQQDPDDVGVVIASAVGGMEEIERNHGVLVDRGVRRVSPSRSR